MNGKRGLGLVLLLVVGLAGGDPQGGRESAVLPAMAERPDRRFVFPIAVEDFRTWSPYGWRVSPTLRVLLHHDGIDVSAVKHAQVVAAGDGVVEEIWPPPGRWWADGKLYTGHPLYGGYVVILHPGGLRTAYAHLAAIWVVWRQAVEASQVIGQVGRTGVATGDHLHFEVRLGELVLNPALYVSIPGGDP